MPDPELLALVQQKLVADHRRFRKANPAASPLLALISARAIDAFAATLLAVIELVLAHRERDRKRPVHMSVNTCPTCTSAQPHLHPTAELCPDSWHTPVPASVGEWRREVTRWADLFDQVVRFGYGPDALTRIVADMRREVAAEREEHAS